ncbi:MAG: hypothetical protein HYT77_06320 [Deltaproteobacteria bacterium]|nr:hypothetical protein [Deltaproteobacteria bacterium]
MKGDLREEELESRHHRPLLERAILEGRPPVVLPPMEQGAKQMADSQPQGRLKEQKGSLFFQTDTPLRPKSEKERKGKAGPSWALAVSRD